MVSLYHETVGLLHGAWLGSAEAEPRWEFLWGDFSRDCSQKKPDGVREAGQGESQAVMRPQL